MRNNSFQWPENITPPIADRQPVQLTAHGDIRTDDYFWLNDYFRKGPQSERVLAYLQEENSYLEKMMAGTKSFQQKLFEELKSRIREKDESVPYFENGYWYYIRFETGSQYAIHCRKKESLSGHEEIIHDSNIAAAGKTFYKAAGLKVSDNNELMAIGEDDVSRRLYTLRFKNLVTGDFFPEMILNTEGDDYAWSADNKTVFYILKDTGTLLGFQVWRHEVGTDPVNDVMVYEEADNRHYLSLKRSKSKKYVIIESELSEQQSEHHLLEAETPHAPFRIFQERTMGLVYDIDHFQEQFYIRTNLDAVNFRLMQTPVISTGIANWTEVIPHRPLTYLAGMTVFARHLVLTERSNGLVQLRIIAHSNNEEHYIAFDEPAYFAFAGNNPDFHTHLFRYNYTSMITPYSVYDYNLDTRERELKKQQEIVGGYDKNNFSTDRLFAPARDGALVPISIVYKKGLTRDGSNPLLLYAYGSYGVSLDADFDRDRLSLLERGFVFAIAHIRGGQEMGRHWYDDGKMLHKKNTFFDFIDCAEYLISERYTSPDHLYANGGSAGGLLMGVINNWRPDLWNGIAADVPYVDVITTMSDSAIPLTTAEYLEWGNPENADEYDYMKSYSPLDNVVPQNFPNLLITTGLHDSQVQYFEPAKWVAKMRSMKMGDNVLLLHTNMDAGHGGASGRFEYLKETALQYAFFLALEGRLE